MTGYESKRAMAQDKLAQPEQEPVAIVHIKDDCLVGSHRDNSKPFPDGQYGLWPIGTTPPQRQPLTDEQIEDIAAKTMFPINFARAIEAAHGIKENT